MPAPGGTGRFRPTRPAPGRPAPAGPTPATAVPAPAGRPSGRPRALAPVIWGTSAVLLALAVFLGLRVLGHAEPADPAGSTAAAPPAAGPPAPTPAGSAPASGTDSGSGSRPADSPRQQGGPAVIVTSTTGSDGAVRTVTVTAEPGGAPAVDPPAAGDGPSPSSPDPTGTDPAPDSSTEPPSTTTTTTTTSTEPDPGLPPGPGYDAMGWLDDANARCNAIGDTALVVGGSDHTRFAICRSEASGGLYYRGSRDGQGIEINDGLPAQSISGGGADWSVSNKDTLYLISDHQLTTQNPDSTEALSTFAHLP